MKTSSIVDGSKGIGNTIIYKPVNFCKVVNISTTLPKLKHANLTHFSCYILQDNLPQIETAYHLIYCPGSINLKSFYRLALDDFKVDFEINVLGAVKTIQHYLLVLKNGRKPAILLFSTVATKLGMLYHTSIAASKSGIEGIIKSLGAELAPTVRINNGIAPTVTNTNSPLNCYVMIK